MSYPLLIVLAFLSIMVYAALWAVLPMFVLGMGAFCAALTIICIPAIILDRLELSRDR